MRKYLYLSGCALFVVQPSLAQDTTSAPGDRITIADERVSRVRQLTFDEVIPLVADGQPRPTITVIANGLPTDIRDTGQPISVIDQGEIDSVQGPDIARVLARVPGVAITRNGPLGGFTGVRVRGASSEQLVVLVDGVRVNDVAAPGGGFDFGNVLPGSVERIELLRGPNSVVWGSDAIGGVINLTTRAHDGVQASAEYGADETIYATLGGGVRSDSLEAGLTASYLDSRGFSASANGTEPDGFRQYQVAGRAMFDVGGGFALTANGRFADGKLGQDGYEWSPPYAFIDTFDFQDTQEWSGRIGGEYAGEALILRVGYAVSSTARIYTGESYGDYPYATDGLSQRAELFGRYDVSDKLKLDFGSDREWVSFKDSGSHQSARTTSSHALLGWYGDALSLSAGARYDDNSLFGGKWTFAANGSLGLDSDWRLRASYGEGFKAPSLYQLYSFYGDTGLAPETSKGYDIGIEKGDRRDSFFATVSAFRRDSRNLIEFDLFNSVYYNIGMARAQGVELELGARPSANLRTGLVYSYVDTEDRTPDSFYEGKWLARRPRHAVTASFDWAGPQGITLGGDIRMVGDSFDDAGNFTSLDGYEVVTLRAAKSLGESLELFGRIENLFDAGYQTVAGYNAQGRAAFVGARLRM